MCPAPESHDDLSAASPSPSSPNFVVALSMGSPEAATPGPCLFSDATAAATAGALRSPPTAEKPVVGAATGHSRGSQGTSTREQRDSPAADTPMVEPEPLPSPAKPAGGGSDGAHPKGLPPLKRGRPWRHESSQPSSTDHTQSGMLPGMAGEQGASPSGTVQPPSAKRAKVTSDSLARTASATVSDALAGAGPSSGAAPAKRPLGGPMLPPRPVRAPRAVSASVIPSWVQTAAEAPSVNAALLKAAAKCPPRDCTAAWQLGLDRDLRWSYVMHGAPGEVPGVDEDAPPMQGWAALHAAATAAPQDLAGCSTVAEAIRLGQEQRQTAAEEARGGDKAANAPRSVRRRGLNLSELAAMVSAAAAGHTSRSAADESLADRTRRVLRAAPSRSRSGRAAAASATGATTLALGRTLAQKIAAHGGSAALPPRPQRNRPGPKPKPKPAPPPPQPSRKTTRQQPKPKPKPKPRARPAPTPAAAAPPPLPPPLPSKDGVWSAGDTWPRAGLYAAGRGSTRALSLNAAAKNSNYDGAGDDMEAWKRLHDALRKAGQLPDPLPGR